MGGGGLNSQHIILKERKSIQENPPTNWKIQDGNNWNVWTIWMTAKNDSPFHSIPIEIKVTFPDNYPHDIPAFRLVKYHLFFHPNISTSDGRPCHQKLRQPNIPIRQRIDGILDLLSIPNPYSCLNSQAGSLCKENQSKYFKKAIRVFRQLQKP